MFYSKKTRNNDDKIKNNSIDEHCTLYDFMLQ